MSSCSGVEKETMVDIILFGATCSCLHSSERCVVVWEVDSGLDLRSGALRGELSGTKIGS